MGGQTQGGIAMAQEPQQRRSTHRTQWAAQFAVASELCKRDYQVALTLGNHPAVDLMVVSPKGIQFLVDVKGLYRPNFWQVQPKKQRDNLFYVLALVPDVGQNRFFVMTQKEVNDDIKKNTDEWRTRDPARANMEDSRPGVSTKCAEQHEDRWDALPR
jgi:hypothetical protein